MRVATIAAAGDNLILGYDGAVATFRVISELGGTHFF
jgi:hypothetical protein